MHTLILSLTLTVRVAAGAAQPDDPLFRIPTATAPACRPIPRAELPPAPLTGTRAVRVHRGYDVNWQSGLGGSRRLRLLEDTVEVVAMVVELISPSLPSAVPPRVAMVALDSAGHVTGRTARLPRDPAEIARRQEALARQDTAALRAAVIGDFKVLSAAEVRRVAPLVRWLRQHCAGARPQARRRGHDGKTTGPLLASSACSRFRSADPARILEDLSVLLTGGLQCCALSIGA